MVTNEFSVEFWDDPEWDSGKWKLYGHGIMKSSKYNSANVFLSSVTGARGATIFDNCFIYE